MVNESVEKNDVYRLLNKSVFRLIKDLPESLQEPGAVFLIKYAGVSYKPDEFFAGFPEPVWSIVYHLQNRLQFTSEELESSIEAHSLSLFLHSLDDHLIDMDIKTDILMLQLRTKAWTKFETLCILLSGQSKTRKENTEFLLNEYFDSLYKQEPETLTDYLKLAGRQSAPWKVIPEVWMSENNRVKMGQAIENLIEAYRILDDLSDIKKDAEVSQKSAVYLAMDEEGRSLWNAKSQSKLWNYLKNKTVVQELAKTGENALRRCAGLAEELGLSEWAGEVMLIEGHFNKDFIASNDN